MTVRGKKNVFTIVLALAFMLCLWFCNGITAAAANWETKSISVTYQQSTARQMLSLVNEFRTGNEAWAWNEGDTEKIYYNNLQPLQYDYELEKVAMLRAAEIAMKFSHTRPSGESCWTAYDDLGYDWKITAGENIAYGYSTYENAYLAWREDNDPYSGQGHRRNMLKTNAKAIGIGHVVYNGWHYWVQEFSGAVEGAAETAANDSDTDVMIKVPEGQGDKKYMTTVSMSPLGSGSITYNGNTESLTENHPNFVISTPNNGSTVQLTCNPNEGYLFKHWVKNGVVVSDQATYTNSLNGENDQLTAVCVETCKITFKNSATISDQSVVWVEKGSVYTLPECMFTNKPEDTYQENYIFSAWAGLGEFKKPGDKITVNENTELMAVWTLPAKMNSALATFEGKIGVVFRVEIPEVLLQQGGAYAIITKNGVETKIPITDNLKEDVDGKTLYRFTKYVVAKEYRENINIKLFYENGSEMRFVGGSGTDYTTTGVNYSLERYVSIKKDSTNAKMAALAIALEDYCTAAQIYFNYDAAGLVASDRVKAVTLDDLEGYKGVFEGNMPSGLKNRAISVAFESDNTFKLIYTFNENIDPKSFTYTIDTNGANLQDVGGEYYLMKSNVAAKNLDKVNTYTISKGGITYNVKCSVLTYARSSVLNGTEERQNLGKALYLYNKAAKEYFGE